MDGFFRARVIFDGSHSLDGVGAGDLIDAQQLLLQSLQGPVRRLKFQAAPG